MESSTPARMIRPKDLEANRTALEECLALIPEDGVKTVLDVRYGLGGWARTVRERFPRAKIVGFEIDAATVNNAWKDKGVNLSASAWTGVGVGSDLLLCDFNVGTIKSRETVDTLTKVVQPRWVIFTDVACVKIHLNYRNYGLISPDMDEYWQTYKVDGYEQLKWFRKHHAACTAVYQRKDPVV